MAMYNTIFAVVFFVFFFAIDHVSRLYVHDVGHVAKTNFSSQFPSLKPPANPWFGS